MYSVQFSSGNKTSKFSKFLFSFYRPSCSGVLKQLLAHSGFPGATLRTTGRLKLMRVSAVRSFLPRPPLLLCSVPPCVTVDISLLQWSLDCGTIPLVCPVGRDGGGRSVALDSTEVTAAISRALQPHKVMFLNNSGGLRSQEQKARREVELIFPSRKSKKSTGK